MVSSAEVPLLDADCKVSAEVECIQERELMKLNVAGLEDCSKSFDSYISRLKLCHLNHLVALMMV